MVKYPSIYTGQNFKTKKSEFLPLGATVYNENFAKSYPPFDKSKVDKYNKGTIEENWQLLRKSLNRWDQHRFQLEYKYSSSSNGTSTIMLPKIVSGD